VFRKYFQTKSKGLFLCLLGGCFLFSVSVRAQTVLTDASNGTQIKNEARIRELTEIIVKIKGDYQKESEKIENEIADLKSQLAAPKDGTNNRQISKKIEHAHAQLNLNKAVIEERENELFILDSEDKLSAMKSIQDRLTRSTSDIEKSQLLTEGEKDRYKLLSVRYVLLSSQLPKKLELVKQARQVSNVNADLLYATEQKVSLSLKLGKSISRTDEASRRQEFLASRRQLLERIDDFSHELKEVPILKDELDCFFRKLYPENKSDL